MEILNSYLLFNFLIIMVRGYKKRTKDGRIIFIPTTQYPPKIEKNKLKSLEQLEKEYKSQNTLPKEESVKGMYGYC